MLLNMKIHQKIWKILTIQLKKTREKYKNHPSILPILQQQFENLFSIRIIPKEEIEKEVLNLNETKASQQLDSTTKIIKMNVDTFCEILDAEINKATELSKLPTCMKIEDVTPMY